MTEEPKEPTKFQASLQKIAEKRWETLKGHELEPVIRSSGQLGGEEIFLPHTPTDWTEMRRIETEYYGAPENGGYDLDRLTPGMKYWMEKLPADIEYEDMSPRGKFFTDLLNWNPVKKTMDFFNYVGQKAELYAGYSYQAAFDPSLRTPEALDTLFGLRDKFDSPEEFVAVFDTLTTEEKNVGAAWWTGQLMYEATGVPFPAEMAAPWAALLFELTPFGTTAKNSDNPGVLKVFEPWETALKGFAHYIDHVYLQDFSDRESAWKTFENTPEWKELMKLTGMDWFFSEETAALRIDRIDQFFEGSYMEDFGGLPQLIKTRQSIANGTPPQQAFDAYGESLGIKRFEAEVQNMLGQITLDPVDWVLMIAKPGQVIKALGNAARLQRVAPQVIDTMADITGLVGKLDDTIDASKLDELATLADDLNIGVVGDAVKDARRLLDEGADTADVLKALDPIADTASQLGEMKTMSRMERISMALTGGDYLSPTRTKVPEFVPVIGGKYWRQINPFALSAQSRADEFLNVSYTNLHVLMRMAGNNVDQMVMLIKKAASGMFGGVMGHMFITPMGRHVQQVVQRIVNGVDDLHIMWNASTGSRKLLNTLAEVVRVSPTQILTAAQKGQKGAQALLEQISESLLKLGDDAPEALLNLRRAIDNGLFTANDLENLGMLFKSTPSKIVPYTPDLFRAAVIKLMAETATEFGAARFGMTEARWLEKAANNVKAVESLLLLGLNPGYPMMNFFNNEVTMIARGVSGIAPWNNIASNIPGVRRFFRSTDEIWETFGINPPRLKEGYGAVGDVDDLFKEIEFSVEGAETWALQSGRNALRSTRWGTPGKVTGYVRDKIANIKDLRAVSAAMEQAASQRAMTSGMLKMWPKFWKKGVGYDLMDDFIPDLSGSLKSVDPDYARIIDNAIASGRRPEDIFMLRKADNLKWNVKELVDRTARKLGIDDTRVANFVTDEVVESVDKILKELGPKASPDEVREAFTVIRDTVEGHIDELVDSQIPVMIDEAMSKASTDGMGGVIDLYGNMVDDVTNRHLAHMSRLDTEVARINKIEDPVLRNRLWKQLKSDADIAWRRTWNREEAIRKGIVKGLKDRGVTVGDEFMEAFRSTRQRSTSYIKKRNALWDEHHKKRITGKFKTDIDRQVDAARIGGLMDKEYTKLIEVTQNGHRVMDATFINALGDTDPVLKAAATEWRTILRDMRRADMESVGEFRRSLRGISEENQIHQAHTEFHEMRANTLGRIQRMEEYGRVMLHGDEEAMRFFTQNAASRGGQRVADVIYAVDPSVERVMRQATAGVKDVTNVGDSPYYLSVTGRKYHYDPEIGTSRLQANFNAVSDDLTAMGRGGPGLDPIEGADEANRIVQNMSASLDDEVLVSGLFGTDVSDPEDALNIMLREGFGGGTTGVDDSISVLIQDVMEGEAEYGLRGATIHDQAGRGGDVTDTSLIREGYTTNRPWVLEARRAGYSDDEILYVLEKIRTGEDIPKVVSVSGKGVAKKIVGEGVEVEGAANRSRALKNLMKRQFEELDGYTLAEEAAHIMKEGRAPIRNAAGTIVAEEIPAMGVPVSGPSHNPPIFDKVVGKEWYMGTGMDELWFEQGTPIYDMMMDEALKVLDEPNVKFSSLPAQSQADLGRYLDHVTGQMNDARLASLRMAEGMRDSALLNYGRRYNIDNWMSVLMPYGFWWTHSIGRWALSTLEYPHMLASYAKVRQFLLNHQGLETNFPERLRGSIRIDIPWAPEEWGDIFINPMRSFGLPFEQFTYPFEQAHFSAANEEKGIERILVKMQEEGSIGIQERDQALAMKDGPVWNRAKALYQQDNDTGGMLDFMQMSTSLHLPISMAANVIRGKPEKIGALPPTRTLKHVATLLGIDPGVYDKVIGNAREAIGLPAFDEWEDYRVDRELSNMSGNAEITSIQSVLAMSNREGPEYQIALDRVAKQEASRFGIRLLGLSTQFYPAGEKEQRELTERFYIALDLRDQGDTDAMKDFFDENPGYEARLALFKDPEERAKAFMADQVWNTWYDMPKVHQDAVKEAFGDRFTEYFLNPETRSLDSISTETMAAWVLAMKQEVPDEYLDVEPIPLHLAPPQDAYQVQAFYNERSRRFPHYWELQQEYYALEEGAPRRKYKADNPYYDNYVEWKWDWLYRNPSLAPYLVDDPDRLPKYESIEELRETQAQEPNFTPEEWISLLGQPLYNLVMDNEQLPNAAQEMLNRLGVGAEQVR